ncbi:MAG: carbohydrate-binding protein [Planctomycetes bacterium]|nr:carbohydrate-binding protein [Planctomycetota bacterium]
MDRQPASSGESLPEPGATPTAQPAPAAAANGGAAAVPDRRGWLFTMTILALVVLIPPVVVLLPLAPGRDDEVLIEAENYVEGNLMRQDHAYGAGVVIDGGRRPAFAVYTMHMPRSGEYEVSARYAAGMARPVNLFLDGTRIAQAFSEPTGGWYPADQRVVVVKRHLSLSQGEHLFRLDADGPPPHLDWFRFRLVREREEPAG